MRAPTDAFLGLQKKGFYNKPAALQVVLTFLYVVSLLFDEYFPWHQDVMPHVRMFLQVISIPVFTLSEGGFYVVWVLSAMLTILTLGVLYAVGYAAYNDHPDHAKSLLRPLLRGLLAIVGTFWITFLRTNITPFQCAWFTTTDWKPNIAGVFADDYDCAATGGTTAVQGVSVLMMLAVLTIMVGQVLGHETDPRSFNALSSEFRHPLILI